MDLMWRKSSYSGSGGECVEVAFTAEAAVAVRDSKAPSSGTLVFPAAAWKIFLRTA
ncbi:DUF397 domain-containing protein [Lentzea sp. E54]|uniref:DUF397 domain-containing protein n=1 Tax=Lentzea xerophila TaxID=3435883 RepID=UPI003DA61B7B